MVCRVLSVFVRSKQKWVRILGNLNSFSGVSVYLTSLLTFNSASMRSLLAARSRLHCIVQAFLWRISLVSAFALALGAVGGARAAPRLADDQRALADLFASTGGPLWKTKTNWLSAAHNACSWFGVQCGPANCSSLVNASIPCRVVSLALTRNNLTGVLPASIWHMDALRKLGLSKNSLSGFIPPSIGSLTSLAALDLSYNRMHGSIPEPISNLSSLVTLNLANNDFSGSLPATFCKFASLAFLDVSINQLIGDLEAPCSFVTIPVLRNVSAVSNRFSGRLHHFMPNITSALEMLVLSSNRISGEIPNSIGEFSRLRYLDLSNNTLNGTIPKSITTLRSLDTLNLAHNPLLSGSIPSEIGNLTNLTSLFLSKMNLSGSIPPSVQHLTSLSFFVLASNQLSGSIPVGIGRLVTLKYLDFNSNLLSGILPDGVYRMTKLIHLKLSNNRFVGTLSESIASLSILILFSAAHNALTGGIPTGLNKISNLYEFDISFNQIEGTLPVSLTNPKLAFFDARSNRISGQIPASLGSLPSISDIYLGSNSLSGTIPADFCSPSSNLQTIDLSDNLLSGFSAANLFSCPMLAKLDLSRNQLRQDFSVRGSLRLPPVVNLSNNRLGPIMEEYSLSPSISAVSVIDIRGNEFSCPYPPNFPATVSLLFSSCAQPWTLLLTYFAIFTGAIFVLVIFALILVRFVSRCSALLSQSPLIVFFLSWAGDCIGLALDSLTLQLILVYLSARIDKCAGLNLYGYFGTLTSAYYYGRLCLDDPINGKFSPSTTMSEFSIACRSLNYAWLPTTIASEFLALCHPVLPQCDVDPVDSTCRTFYPELASDARGEVHRVFFVLVIAVAAVRLVVELARAACVFIARRRISVLAEPHIGHSCCSEGGAQSPLRLHWMAELVGSSPFAPLLYVATSRAEFTNFLLQREPTPADFSFRALHAGFLTSIPILAVNAWYLLRVTQYGLAPAGWLSLMKGLVLVPRLLFQAYRATRPGAGKHQRSAADAIRGQSVDLGMMVSMGSSDDTGSIAGHGSDDRAHESTVGCHLQPVLGAVTELSNS
jgi:Leucine-rich repeat (LRR) protein